MTTEKKPFDLSKFELQETATLTVEDPRGGSLLVDGEEVKITVYGPGSKQHRKAKRILDNASNERAFAALRNKPMKNADEQAEKDKIAFLTACTVQIDNFPVSPEEIYSNPGLAYITKQVEAFILSDENFMPAPAKK